MQIENLSAYEPETDAILQWCADWLGQDAYDDLARMHDLTVMPVYHAYKGTDYLLPSLAGNPAGRRGDWIFLVQALADNDEAGGCPAHGGGKRMKTNYVGTRYAICVPGAEGVAQRWATQYENWEDGSDKAAITKRLLDGGDKLTPDEVAGIIGNKSWTHPHCDQHMGYVNRAVRFGDYEPTATVCEECLRGALKALSEQST